jgi:ABC-type branched-subunit amino acid transport system substrate-binding protein
MHPRDRQFRATLGAAVIALLGSTAIGSAQTACDPAEKAPGVTDDSILLGATMPLTGSGATVGLGVEVGAKAYFDMVNAAGGIKGRTITYKVVDDEYSPARAQQQMRSLVQRDGIFLVAGGEGTPNFLAVAPFLKREGVPAIAPYAPSSELGTMDFPNIFMTWVNYVTEFQIMAKHIIDTASPRSISLVGVQGNVGDDARKGIEAAIGSADIKLNYIPEVPGTPDFTPIATQLRDYAADWTFLILTNTDTGQLLQAMQRIGYTPKTAAWAGMDDQDYLTPFSSVSQDMIVAEETAHLDSPDPLVKQFIADFTKQTGKAPTKFNELGWVQAQITVKALGDAEAMTRSCVMKALEGMKDFKTGILPPITFGPDKRQGVNAVGLVQIKGDTTVEIVPFTAVD